MTVAELIEELQSMPQDAEIQVSLTSSDYWRTRICKSIDNIEQDIVVEHSDYHQCDKVSNDEYQEMDEEDLDDSIHSKIVVINI